MQSALNIFPNPYSDEFTIHNAQDRIEVVNIYDALGRKILSRQAGTKIIISMLKAGIYIAKTKTAESAVKKKFVKQ